MNNPLFRWLSVTEKNDSKVKIGKILSSLSEEKTGDIFKFKIEVEDEECDMIMESVSGHLYKYEFEGKVQYNWEACKPKDLFNEKIKKTSINVDTQKKIEEKAKECDGLIIWTDCDREGENIGFEIIETCRKIKPDLKVKRAVFNTTTQASVTIALKNLQEPNQNINDAVNVRQEIDFRTVCAFTRLIKKKIQEKKYLSEFSKFGLCFFPLLGFIYDRYEEVENFKSELSSEVVVFDGKNYFSNKESENLKEYNEMRDVCKNESLATVQRINQQLISIPRPLPLTTIELQKIGSRKLGLDANTIMNITERLYLGGFISYPRTGTNIFAEELELESFLERQKNDPRWGRCVGRILENGKPIPSQGEKHDQAHHPIYPIENLSAKLDGNYKKVYDFIVESFLACFLKDAKATETTVDILVGNRKFSASGLTITENNYLDVYSSYEESFQQPIVEYKVNQKIEISIQEQKYTSNPLLLDEAELLTLMEENKIGTDSTRARHIEDLKDRKYVKIVSEKRLIPTALGIRFIKGLREIGLLPLTKPDLRAELTNDLNDICEGRQTPESVLDKWLDKYKSCFQTLEDNIDIFIDIINDSLNRQSTNENPSSEVTIKEETEDNHTNPKKPRLDEN